MTRHKPQSSLCTPEMSNRNMKMQVRSHMSGDNPGVPAKDAGGREFPVLSWRIWEHKAPQHGEN